MKLPTKEQLINLQKKLKTDRAIGERYGVSRQIVFQWRKKHGIRSLRELTEARNYQIAKLFQAGLTTKELVKKFKLSTTTICKLTRMVKRAI